MASPIILQTGSGARLCSWTASSWGCLPAVWAYVGSEAAVAASTAQSGCMTRGLPSERLAPCAGWLPVPAAPEQALPGSIQKGECLSMHQCTAAQSRAAPHQRGGTAQIPCCQRSTL